MFSGFRQEITTAVNQQSEDVGAGGLPLYPATVHSDTLALLKIDRFKEQLY